MIRQTIPQAKSARKVRVQKTRCACMNIMIWREGAKIQFLPSSGARESACRDVTMEDFSKSRATPHMLHKCAASRNLHVMRGAVNFHDPWNSLGRLAGRCGVAAFHFLSLSLLPSPRSGSIVDPWTAYNIIDI